MERKFNIGDLVETKNNKEAIVRLSYTTASGVIAYAIEFLKQNRHSYLYTFTRDSFLKSRDNIIGDIDSVNFRNLSFVYEYILTPAKNKYIEEDE